MGTKGTVWARLLIMVFVMTPLVTWANPVMIDGQSLLAFVIVAFWALVVESGITALTLVSCGVCLVPLFVALIIANVAIFLFAFLPLTGRVSLWALEAGVVFADAFFVKFLASMPFLQGGGFVRVSWQRAFVASTIGNAASFFIGVIGSGAPWVVHDPAMGVE